MLRDFKLPANTALVGDVYRVCLRSAVYKAQLILPEGLRKDSPLPDSQPWWKRQWGLRSLCVLCTCLAISYIAFTPDERPFTNASQVQLRVFKWLEGFIIEERRTEWRIWPNDIIWGLCKITLCGRHMATAPAFSLKAMASVIRYLRYLHFAKWWCFHLLEIDLGRVRAEMGVLSPTSFGIPSELNNVFSSAGYFGCKCHFFRHQDWSRMARAFPNSDN